MTSIESPFTDLPHIYAPQNPKPSLQPHSHESRRPYTHTHTNRTHSKHHGPCPHKDREEVVAAGDRGVLLANDPGLSHEQEGPGGGGHHSLEAPAQQDRRVLDPPHEADPEGSGPGHLPHAPGGGARAPHGLRARRLRHQHRPHRGRQGDPRHARGSWDG